MVSTYFRTGLLIAFIIIVLDQVSKWWMLIEVMQPPRIIIITPFFNLVSGWNRGVSFGMFSSSESWSGWVLSLLALGIVGFLLNWLRKAESTRYAVSIGLIIGGALGNVADRMMHGAVFDFLDFHVSGYHWPAFNVADSGITVGAVILVLDSLLTKQENRESDDSKDSTE